MATTQELQAESLLNATRNGEYWTQTEVDALFEAFEAGASLSDIAGDLNRSYYGVASMHSLGKREAKVFVERQFTSAPKEEGYTFLEYNEDWDL